jgi:hypothetical protein
MWRHAKRSRLGRLAALEAAVWHIKRRPLSLRDNKDRNQGKKS